MMIEEQKVVFQVAAPLLHNPSVIVHIIYFNLPSIHALLITVIHVFTTFLV